MTNPRGPLWRAESVDEQVLHGESSTASTRLRKVVIGELFFEVALLRGQRQACDGFETGER